MYLRISFSELRLLFLFDNYSSDLLGINTAHLLQGEHALPQQFVHAYKDNQFVTTPVSHSGG